MQQIFFTIWSYGINAKIKIPQSVIFIKQWKFDTADIKCFTVHSPSSAHHGNFLGLF